MRGIQEDKLPLVLRRAFKQGTDGCSLQEWRWVFLRCQCPWLVGGRLLFPELSWGCKLAISTSDED